MARLSGIAVASALCLMAYTAATCDAMPLGTDPEQAAPAPHQEQRLWGQPTLPGGPKSRRRSFGLFSSQSQESDSRRPNKLARLSGVASEKATLPPPPVQKDDKVEWRAEPRDAIISDEFDDDSTISTTSHDYDGDDEEWFHGVSGADEEEDNSDTDEANEPTPETPSPPPSQGLRRNKGAFGGSQDLGVLLVGMNLES